MPYIEPKERPPFDKVLDQLKPETLKTKGQLEYCIFKLMKIYMKGQEVRYANLHDTVFAAMHCALEYQRRYLDGREDNAMLDNGDVE